MLSEALLPAAQSRSRKLERKDKRLCASMLLTSLLRRHILGMGLTASALSSSAPAAKGAIRYRQLWVSADGVTHIDEHECGKLETKDFTSTGGWRCPNRRPFGPHASDATRASHRQYAPFSDSDDFALTGLVVTQQVGEKTRGTSALRRSSS